MIAVAGPWVSTRGPAFEVRKTRRDDGLLKPCPRPPSKLLNEGPQKMMGLGLVHRAAFGEKPPLRVEYSLTSFGTRLARVLDEIKRLEEELDRNPL